MACYHGLTMTGNEVEQTVMAFWSTFASRKKDAVSQCMSFIDNEFTGYGTEQHELWLSSIDFKKQLIQELEFAPDPVEISPKSMHTVISGSVAICIADMLYRFKAQGKELEIDPFRLVMTLHETSQGIKFLSMASISFDSRIPEQVPWPGLIQPKKYEDVSILFTDFVGFSNTVAAIPPKNLVNELNEIFSAFDEIVVDNNLEKVKTIGDAYMAVSGVRPNQSGHAINAVKAGIDMINFLEARNRHSALKWELRAGVHSGPVVAGIVGKYGLSFDVWGSTVNLANQLEQKGEPGKVNISAYSYHLVKSQFQGEYRGKIQVKNQGMLDMYFIDPVTS